MVKELQLKKISISRCVTFHFNINPHFDILCKRFPTPMINICIPVIETKSGWFRNHLYFGTLYFK